MAKTEEEIIADKVDKILNTRMDKIKEKFLSEVESQLSDVVKDLTKQISDNVFGDAFANGINAALGSALKGNKLDARSIVNSAASAFAPAIQDYFNPSSAQRGDDLLGMLSRANRNN